MKFAKYLETDAVPEWNKAYINYRGLKKHLKILKSVSTCCTHQRQEKHTQRVVLTLLDLWAALYYGLFPLGRILRKS